MTTRVLALDIGSTYAAAFDGPNGKPGFTHEDRRMPGDRESFGPIFGKFASWLRDQIKVHAPDVMGCEAPFISFGGGGRVTPLAVARLLIGMTAVAEAIAYIHGKPFHVCQVATVRKAFAGNGRADKAEIERRAFLLGWTPANSHEADAGAVWAHLKMQHDRSFALPPPGALFGQDRVRVTA